MNSKNKKGITLIVIVMVMAILVILGAALLQIALADTKFSTLSNNKVQAHYIGRTGVEVGKKILDNAMSSNTFTTINEVVTYIQGKANALGTVNVKDAAGINNIGSFNIRFDKFGPDSIKITARDATLPSTVLNNTVTYIVKIKSSYAFTDNPEDWLSGVNLNKSYGPNNKYIKGARLGGKKIQSPQNGTPSTFRSEIIYFLNNDDNISFRQIPNSIDVTFDAFIIYSEGGFLLNKKGDPVILTASADNILANWNQADPGTSITNAGFESLETYRDFVRNVTTDPDVTKTFHDEYSFGSGNYGIAYFGGDVVVDNGPSNTRAANFEGPGYYFFRSGVNLQSINPDNKDLIKIDPNDPVIESLNSFFRYHSSTEGSIWNYQ